MNNKGINNVKLGIFVLGGLLFLILLLYMIGRNRNLFQSNYLLKVRLKNAQGLVKGNNVRYAGIESGTVSDLTFINDTIIEVSMLIDEKLKNIIRKNAIASIGTEGLVGNKVVNIVSSAGQAPPAQEGDILQAKTPFTTDDAMDVLQNTSKEILSLAADLKLSIQHLNNSQGLWQLLSDKSIPFHLRQTAANIAATSRQAEETVSNLNELINDTKNGQGNLGILLRDSTLALNLTDAGTNMGNILKKTDSLVMRLNDLTANIHTNLNNHEGVVNRLLTDSVLSNELERSLKNIEAGTAAFNQNMIALQQNFLFRGYFRKQARKNRQSGK